VPINKHMKLNSLLKESILSADKEEQFYNILDQSIRSGPFDGGCILVALALKKVFGGKIVVLVNPRKTAEHAALQLGNSLMDYDGKLPINAFIERFEQNERVEIAEVREIRSDDLPDASRDPKIASMLADIIQS